MRGLRALQRDIPHQLRQAQVRRDAFAHDGAAQRADAVEGVEAEAAQALHGKQIREQRAIEEIDRDGAAGRAIMMIDHGCRIDIRKFFLRFPPITFASR